MEKYIIYSFVSITDISAWNKYALLISICFDLTWVTLILIMFINNDINENYKEKILRSTILYSKLNTQS